MPGRSLILGTAGHIDHGKTELVRALTGIDTDRLKEEKERGITIELGFAHLPGTDVRLGVVDVPGHEGFVRTMLAGATGMDVVILVVAADEGVMPQTREHLAIVSLLGVQRLVVALTKADLVEPEWMELVRDDVRQALAATPYAQAPLVATSSRTGEGVEALRATLLETAAGADPGDPDDLTVLPVDRAFTVRGTGTVVTGTLGSGHLRTGQRVRLLPEGLEARVRGLQVHGDEVGEAIAGVRVAVALGGEAMDLEHVRRGQTLVAEPAWAPSAMLTVRLAVLADTDWEVAHNQRVRVHLGTAEVMARVAVPGGRTLGAGDRAWAQLRLEAPVGARARQRAVLRSYSPMTTIAGAEVVEPHPPKRRAIEAGTAGRLASVLEGDPRDAADAAASLAGIGGTLVESLPVAVGLPPGAMRAAVDELVGDGAILTPEGLLVHGADAAAAEALLLGAVDRIHRAEPFRPGVPIEEVRSAAPDGAAPGLADALLARMVERGVLRLDHGIVARAGFAPSLTDAQKALEERLAGIYRGAGLQAPTVADLPRDARDDPAFWVLLRRLEAAGRVTAVDDGLFVWSEALTAAVGEIRTRWAGRDGLAPADFKEAMPVSRRWLMPLLAWLDRTGVTRREGEGRSVLPHGPEQPTGSHEGPTV